MTDPLDALERLARLRDQGVLSDEEFAGEKSRILRGLAQPGASNPDFAIVGGRHDSVLGRLGASRWKAVSIAAALVGGAVLAFFVRSDIDSASTRQPTGDGAQPKAVAEVASRSSANLAAVISFEETGSCAPREGLNEIIAQMRSAANAHNAAADGAIRILGVEQAIPAEVRRSEDGPGMVTLVQIPVEGDWNGLHLRAVKTSFWGERGVSTLQLVFSEPAEQSRSMLRQLGFKVSRVGELTSVDGAGESFQMVGVEALGSGSALTCARDARIKGAAGDAAHS